MSSSHQQIRGISERIERGAILFHQEGQCFIDVHFPLSIRTQCFMRRQADIFLPIEIYCKDTQKCEYTGHCACPIHLYSFIPVHRLGWSDSHMQTRRPLSPVPQTQLIGQEVGTSPNQTNLIGWPANSTWYVWHKMVNWINQILCYEDLNWEIQRIK